MAFSGPDLGVIALAILIAGLAGVVRGITGFGGAMVMSPPLAFLVGPLLTVPVVLLLEGFVATPMLVQTRSLVRWRLIGPIVTAAALTVPLGAWLLKVVDAETMRRVIAIVVIVFSSLLLVGWRYSGAQRMASSVGLGAVSGTMVGATSMGGPPVILYLLAGPDPIDVTRANLTFFVAAISAIGLAALWVVGLVDWLVVACALVLAPLYYGGMVLGVKLFARFDDVRFRRFTLGLMLAVSVGILIA